PALIAQMERLQEVAARRAEAQGALVDANVPYFAHLRLREEVAPTGPARHAAPQAAKERDVFIGRATYVDAARGVRIVDWRHAPVSQLYYRYAEGTSYEERFGDRDVEGEVLVRRTVTIERGKLIRISSPQGGFVRNDDGGWTHYEPREIELAGGQGSAV